MTTISIISAGAMGSALASKLGQAGSFKILSLLQGRSAETAARAEKAGMHDASPRQIAQDSRIILSVLPPSEAATLASDLAGAATHDDTSSRIDVDSRPIYCDLNAVSPETSKRVSEIVGKQFRFVDGCIIGGPPKDSYQPTIYLSGDDQEAVREAEQVLGQNGKILKVRVLTNQGDGAASALKLSYAGMTKGFTALAATMILAAAKQSPETASALLQELTESRPDFVKSIASTVPASIPKAYRFVGEMEEIAAYIQTNLGGASSTYTGIAELYQRVADDLKGSGEDCEILRDFGNQARDAQQQER